MELEYSRKLESGLKTLENLARRKSWIRTVCKLPSDKALSTFQLSDYGIVHLPTELFLSGFCVRLHDGSVRLTRRGAKFKELLLELLALLEWGDDEQDS